ncbi:hypothetical protein [Streptomyces cinereoruber]|uniref:hypothetical protein n=1 Tax=Streptomyces cinereoruber TaxID=67260 RepID=UPI00363BFF01
MSLLLYAVVAILGLPLAVLWIAAKRERKNAGFASKAQLRRHLSAKAVLRATEIRPSLMADGPRRRPGVDLSKRRRRSHAS